MPLSTKQRLARQKPCAEETLTYSVTTGLLVYHLECVPQLREAGAKYYNTSV